MESQKAISSRLIHLTLCGVVQGVFFRAWTCKTAHDLALTGWVRNRADGCVEAVATGSFQAIDSFIAACWQGPDQARVDSIKITDCQIADLPEPLPDRGFIQKPSL